jgi:hypothetical protein
MPSRGRGAVPQVFATKEFMRLARRQGIEDEKLCEAAVRAERGLVDADLRGGLIKQRVPRRGQGRRGGFRVLAAFRARHRCVFLYSFAKNERDNIDDDELAHWQRVATAYLQMAPDRLEALMQSDELREIPCDE